MNLLIFSDARLKTDFRKPLLDAARTSGASTIHIYFPQYDEGDILITDDQGIRLFHPQRVDEITDHILARWKPDKDILLTGLNGAFSRSAMSVQRKLRPSLSFYDVYDDVRFGKRGVSAVKVLFKDFLWRRLCRYCLVHNPDLKDVYRNSIVLDTASHVTPMDKEPGVLNENILLYVGSIDERTDFDLIESLLQAGHQIHMYGRTHGRDASVLLTLRRLVDGYHGLKYFGAYDNEDMSNILRYYRFGIVPYKINFALTEYINPHKVYHYLNAGLTVFTTDVPYVRFLKDYVYIIDRHTLVEDLIAKSLCDKHAKVWNYRHFTWQKRWIELSRISEVLLSSQK